MAITGVSQYVPGPHRKASGCRWIQAASLSWAPADLCRALVLRQPRQRSTMSANLSG